MIHYPQLMQSLDLGFCQLDNRVIMGSMHTGLEDIGAFDRLAAFYRERAAGGVGLIITGGFSPNDEGNVFADAAKLSDMSDLPGHQMVTDAVHDEGGKICLQILHTGRYGYSENNVSCSAIRSPITPYTPRALSDAEIERQIDDFVACAQLAQQAGYDGVEVMGSEGYFINQFLVRHTNKREDRWGGSYANRMRLPVEIVRRIRAATGPNFIIIYRISLIDLIPDGSSFEETVTLAQAIEAAGATMLNSGIGWHETRIPTIATSVPRAAFSWVTGRMKPHISIPIIATNRINDPATAEDILVNDQADLVSMARPFLADSQFVAKARAGAPEDITPCIACNQACLDHTFSKQIASCLLNPRACHETELTYPPTNTPRRIAVIGAGPAGINFALIAHQRGHQPILFDQATEVGGQLNLAKRIPGKEEFVGMVAYYQTQLEKAQIPLHLGHAVTADELLQADYDDIVIATGVRPFTPDIPTDADAPVVGYLDVLNGTVPVGDRLVIIGAGGIGFDVAAFVAHDGPSLTLDQEAWMAMWGVSNISTHRAGLAPTEAEPDGLRIAGRTITMLQRKMTKPGAGLGKTTGWIHRRALRQVGVRMLKGLSYRRFTRDGVVVADSASETGERLEPADTIILCTGQTPLRILADELADKLADKLAKEAAHTPAARQPELHIIGGADEARELDAKQAIKQAAELAASL